MSNLVLMNQEKPLLFKQECKLCNPARTKVLMLHFKFRYMQYLTQILITFKNNGKFYYSYYHKRIFTCEAKTAEE